MVLRRTNGCHEAAATAVFLVLLQLEFAQFEFEFELRECFGVFECAEGRERYGCGKK